MRGACRRAPRTRTQDLTRPRPSFHRPATAVLARAAAPSRGRCTGDQRAPHRRFVARNGGRAGGDPAVRRRGGGSRPGSTAVTVTRTTPAVGGAPMAFTPAFTPVFPNDYAFPATTILPRELRRGDEASILHNDYDKTFGSLLLRGKGSDGYCGPWTFTLPYSAAGLWQFAFSYSDVDGGDAYTPYTLIHGTNAPAPAASTTATCRASGSACPTAPTGRHGHLDRAPVRRLRPARRGHALGRVRPVRLQAVRVGHQPCAPFSFTASVPGTITVFYNDAGHPEDGGPNFAGAGIDPKVIDVRVASSVPSAPHAHMNVSVSASGKGFVGAGTYTGTSTTTSGYRPDRYPRFKTQAGGRSGCCPRRHGHHAAHNERRYVPPRAPSGQPARRLVEGWSTTFRSSVPGSGAGRTTRRHPPAGRDLADRGCRRRRGGWR